jgi:D-tyrosyl-tRNA(Tyr) deacylase
VRIVVQRVSAAAVRVGDEVVGEIGHGLLALVGVAREDDDAAAARLAARTAGLRIFPDEAGRFAHAVADVGGAVLAVSQFTLIADTRKGNRPSFSGAADPERALALYERYCDELAALGVPVARGRFGAAMAVELVNEGPVTIVLD